MRNIGRYITESSNSDIGINVNIYLITINTCSILSLIYIKISDNEDRTEINYKHYKLRTSINIVKHEMNIMFRWHEHASFQWRDLIEMKLSWIKNDYLYIITVTIDSKFDLVIWVDGEYMYIIKDSDIIQQMYDYIKTKSPAILQRFMSLV
jgi:hypothetical protein